jgi:hypothetical protein
MESLPLNQERDWTREKRNETRTQSLHLEKLHSTYRLLRTRERVSEQERHKEDSNNGSENGQTDDRSQHKNEKYAPTVCSEYRTSRVQVQKTEDQFFSQTTITNEYTKRVATSNGVMESKFNSEIVEFTGKQIREIKDENLATRVKEIVRLIQREKKNGIAQSIKTCLSHENERNTILLKLLIKAF